MLFIYKTFLLGLFWQFIGNNKVIFQPFTLSYPQSQYCSCLKWAGSCQDFYKLHKATAQSSDILIQSGCVPLVSGWPQDVHQGDFKYSPVWKQQKGLKHFLSGLPLRFYWAPCHGVFRLVYVKAEVWLRKSPWCWVLRGCGSVASTPCCSLCSSAYK